MTCLQCGGSTGVVNSRPQKRSNQVWRRRQCLDCGSIFTTTETADYAGVLRVRSHNNNRLTPFSRDKLFLSLHKSLGHRKTALRDAAGLTATVITKVTPSATNGVIPSQTIIQTVIVALNRFDRAAATHYQAFHAR